MEYFLESPPIDDLKLLSYIQKTGKNYNDLDLLAITQNTGLMSKRTKKLTKSQTITRPSAQFIAERLEKFFPGIEGINLEPSAAPSITTSGNNGSVGSNPSVSISMTESRSDINNNVNPPEKLHHFNRRPVGDALSARRVSRQDFNYLASLPQSSLRNSSFFTDFGEPTSCDTPVSTKSFQLASAFSIRISQSKASMNIKDIVLEKVEIQRQESVRKRDTIRTRRQKLREGYRPALKKIHSTTFHDDYRESAEILNDVDLVTSRMEKDIKQMEQEADKIFHSINDEDVLKKPLSSPLPATTPSPAATTTATVTEPHPDSAFWSPSKDELKLQRIEEGRVKGQPIIPSISLSDGVPPLALNDKMVPEIGLVSGSDDEEESRIEMWYQGDMIGQGAYGRVYLGLNFKNWELMAVKQVEIGKFEFKKGEMTPEEAIQKEIGILKTLNDINIVRYFGKKSTK